MAQRLTYEVSRPRAAAGDREAELEQLASRLEELNTLLDALYERGVIRLLTDLVQATPEISEILLRGLNTEGGQAGLQNLVFLARQLGRIEPERMARMIEAVNTGFDRMGEPAPAEASQPPGVTGLIRLLRDEQLWRSLGPVLEGVKAFIQALGEDGKKEDGQNT